MTQATRPLKPGKKYHAYIASPWFNPFTNLQVSSIEMLLEKYGYKYFSPRKETNCPPNASMELKKKAFENNVKGIEDSEFIIVNTSSSGRSGGSDTGTIFEAGTAYALNIPIVYVCFDLPKGAQFNLMLAQSGIHVALNLQELEDFLANNKAKQWTGDIE